MGPPPGKPAGLIPFADLDDDKPLSSAGIPLPAAESSSESSRPVPHVSRR